MGISKSHVNAQTILIFFNEATGNEHTTPNNKKVTHVRTYRGRSPIFGDHVNSLHFSNSMEIVIKYNPNNLEDHGKLPKAKQINTEIFDCLYQMLVQILLSSRYTLIKIGIRWLLHCHFNNYNFNTKKA